MTGWVAIIGIGPGDEALWTSQVRDILNEATDVVGYIPYVNRISDRAGLMKHASDNRVEIDRSRHALEMAATGRKVVIVSSGDPGVFAMASAVFEAVDDGPEEWRALDIRVCPGITAMLAASASAGAVLGHDFAAINLSDNLKPWEMIERRLRLVVEGDFAAAFYNPRSKTRPEGFEKFLHVLSEVCEPERILIFARNVSLADETLRVVRLKDATPDLADMRTVVLLGSSRTKVIDRDGAPWVYTPRFAE